MGALLFALTVGAWVAIIVGVLFALTAIALLAALADLAKAKAERIRAETRRIL